MNQGNNPDAPADVPLKRKRGRPRKHHSIISQGVNAHFPRHHSLKHVRAPPGFQDVNGHQPYPVGANGEAAVDPVVGQVVTGVVEASFGDGYLLNVRVGNSETTLRGVVFKPGCYVPVSRENDVAPNVGMVKRHEVSLPPENYTRAHRNGTHSGKGKLVPSVANPSMSRGNVVPVVLQPMDQPVDVSNRLPLVNQPSPVLSQTSLHFSSRVKQAPSASSKAPRPFEPEATQHEGEVKALHDTEMKSLEMSGMPMEKLLAEVIRRGQSHSQSGPQQDMNTFGNIDQPLSIEPLQAVQPHQHNNHSVSSTRPFEKERIGKMTELLQVVQERMTENQAPRVPLPNLGESQMPENAGDNEAMH